MEEIVVENIKNINIKVLALNKDKFGPLIFEESYPRMEGLRSLFVELDELDYKSKLTEEEANNIDSRKKNFITQLTKLNEFDLKSDPNFTNTHDNFERDVIALYNSASKDFRGILVYLRQEITLKNQSEKELQDQKKQSAKAEKRFNELSAELASKLEKLDAQKQQIETKKGVIASKILAYHFSKQANDYIKNADGEIVKKKCKPKKYWLWGEQPEKEIEVQAGGWLRRRNLFFNWLIIIIVANLILYFAIFFLNKIGIITMQTKDWFTIEYGVGKLALLTLLYYGVHFASRNYYVNANLAAINKHRKNVALTLDDYLETNPEKGTRSQMIKQGTQAMFEHLPNGYLTKAEKQDSNLINEIINTIPKKE